MEKKQNKANTFISLLGLLLLLLGIYMSVRTGINLAFFKKYPSTGVMSIISPFGMPYSQREEDCTMMYTPYFKPDGQPRTPTSEEKKIEEQQKKVCLNGVIEARNTAKINDISSSLLFLFLGVGVLIGKRYF